MWGERGEKATSITLRCILNTSPSIMGNTTNNKRLWLMGGKWRVRRAMARPNLVI